MTIRQNAPQTFRTVSSLACRFAFWLGSFMCLFMAPSWWLPVGNPSAVGRGFREVFMQHFVSLELLLAVVILGFVAKLQRPRVAWILAVALAACLLFEVYEVFILRSFSRPPNLHNDQLLIWDGINLALDLLPGGALSLLLAALLAACCLVLIIYVGLKQIQRTMQFAAPRTVSVVAGMTMLASLAVCVERSPHLRDALVQSTTARMVENIGRSRGMLEELDRLALEPPVAGMKSRLARVVLEQTPNVYLLIIESYGSVLLHTPGSLKFKSLLQIIESRFANVGFQTFTHLSVSPVVGGASWQATSTLLSGLPITNQHLFTMLHEQEPFGLPRFFSDRGYHTWTLQPGYRTRPGRPVSNTWGFDETLYFNALNYRGKRWGWGVVPDQYALGFARQAMAQNGEGPHFMAFSGVSTHAPWNNFPPHSMAWQSLGEPERVPPALGFAASILEKWKAHDSPCFSAACLEGAMALEWQVLAKWVEGEQASRALFIIVGDHQPPVVANSDASVPIHIVARGVKQLEMLETLGFARGMLPGTAPAMHHAGVFSLVARLLTEGADQPAPLYERGISAAALVAPKQ